MRADLYAAAALGISRNKAAELLKSGELLINNKCAKCSDEVADGAKCELLGQIYVSRAAFKLKGFLNESLTEAIAGARCVDVGASTGGFTQILLECGAASVAAVDVGRDQLHPSLIGNNKVKVCENTDIRDFVSSEKFDVITADLSFISLSKVLVYLNNLAHINTHLILLYKPQFEVGKAARRSKNGVVKDERAIAKARADFERECAHLGWILQRSERSQIAGKEGNFEYLYHFTR